MIIFKDIPTDKARPFTEKLIGKNPDKILIDELSPEQERTLNKMSAKEIDDYSKSIVRNPEGSIGAFPNRTYPWCDTCWDEGECMGMNCYGGLPVEETGECPDCDGGRDNPVTIFYLELESACVEEINHIGSITTERVQWIHKYILNNMCQPGGLLWMRDNIQLQNGHVSLLTKLIERLEDLESVPDKIWELITSEEDSLNRNHRNWDAQKELYALERQRKYEAEENKRLEETIPRMGVDYDIIQVVSHHDLNRIGRTTLENKKVPIHDGPDSLALKPTLCARIGFKQDL